MLRLSSRFNTSSCKKVASLWKDQQVRPTSHSSSAGKGVNKALIAGAGITTTLVGGVIGYSAWNNENRKAVEENIPGASFLLEPLLGPLPEPPKAKPVELPKSDAGLLKKKLDREKAQEKEMSPSIATGAPVSNIPAPPISVPVAPTTASPSEVKKEAQSSVNYKDAAIEKENLPSEDLEKRLAVGEQAEAAENALLDKRLKENIADAQILVTSALSASEDATKAIRHHTEKAYAAIDSGEDDASLYAVAAGVAKAKNELVKAAENKLNDAKHKIETLQNQITAGKDSKLTKNNSVLLSAEEALAELNYAVSKINSAVAEATRDTSALREFGKLVEASRAQFEAEVRSLLPDVKLGETSDKLTQDELNLLLAHAHRKVIALQKTLAKQQTVDQERYRDSVLRQRDMESKVLDRRLQSELEKQRRDIGLEYRHRLQQLREDLEIELRTQLKRQAAAHSDHLADVLHVQEQELDIKWENKLKDDLQTSTDNYNKTMSKIQGDLKGLKSALKSRADADNASHAAHELWFTCEALLLALRLGQAEARSWEDQLFPLKDKIDAIMQSAGKEDALVNAVVSSLSETALTRGVYTEDALRERFLKVDRVCRRVALVGESGGSLPKYLLSYIQSFFLVGAFDRIPASEMKDEEIDPEELNTHDILARARFCLAKDDLMQAVKYLNLLRGEARLVAGDWINEARLSLEVKQAANVLLTHAAATGARAL